MGTRYDFELTANLREDLPENVVRILAFLLCPGEVAPEEQPEHPFFGPLTWREALLFLRLHDLDHAGQLSRIAAALA